MSIEQLRESLIKDIVSELDKSVPAHLSDENNKEYADLGLELGNTITQIIVDTFDEYEYDTQQARLYTEDIKAQDRELNKKYK